MKPWHYSERLGVLTPEQLQAGLDHFNLGRLLDARPASGGLFGQNVLLTSTAGAFVLRGHPHRHPQLGGQLGQEHYFAHLLHERTDVPVPWPYLIDPITDIFGWDYAILPRLPGLALSDPDVQRQLTAQDRLDIATALGDTLGRLQALTWDAPGVYDERAGEFVPHTISHADWIAGRVREVLAAGRAASPATTERDVAWVEEVLTSARDALSLPFQPAYVHLDYTESNVLAERHAGAWRISGVVDLHTSEASDGEMDLARAVAFYAPRDPGLLDAFLRSYFARRPPRPGLQVRFGVYTLLERLLIWEYGQRNRIWFDAGTMLREWAEPFTSRAVL
jgi:hygromycin-B 7''-O-kinase